MKLEFQKPVFNDGKNISVRRGVKWSGAKGIVPINDSLQAEILFTQTFVFFSLLNSDLENEHDPACRTYNGLLKEMDRVYPGFDEREIVTIVHFNVLNGKSSPAFSYV